MIYDSVLPWLADRRLLTRLPLAAIVRTPLGPVRRLPAAVIEARLRAQGLGADRLMRAVSRGPLVAMTIHGERRPR